MNTDTIVTTARARFDHEAAKRTLREKYHGRLVFAHAGGMFKATPELISFLKSYDHSSDAIITDLYDNPVRVNIPQLLSLVIKLYDEQMVAWLNEYTELSKNR